MLNLELPHRRYNPLTDEWVLVSPQRARRPWLGQVEKIPPAKIPPYDPQCYLCPGNLRVSGERNAQYESTYVFDNDFQALLTPLNINEEAQSTTGIEPTQRLIAQNPAIFKAQSEFGISQVVCFSPRHDLSLPQFSQKEIELVIRTWMEQSRQLGAKDFINYVQVFENKGAMMGASNPHPHSQIWAASNIPNELAKEMAALTAYRSEHKTCMICDTLHAEQASAERIVVSNPQFTVLVPFWAVWPFETLLISQRHIASLEELSDEEVSALADILRQLTTRYDNLFEVSFPYSMGFHQAPSDGALHLESHLHAHFYPPLLRSATVKKFMVGFEMLAMPQRDLTAESAARRLRELSDIHYLSQI